MLNTNIHSPESNHQVPGIDALLYAEGIKWKVDERTLLSGLLASARISETTRAQHVPPPATRFPLHLVSEIIPTPEFHSRDYRHAA